MPLTFHVGNLPQHSELPLASSAVVPASLPTASPALIASLSSNSTTVNSEGLFPNNPTGLAPVINSVAPVGLPSTSPSVAPVCLPFITPPVASAGLFHVSPIVKMLPVGLPPTSLPSAATSSAKILEKNKKSCLYNLPTCFFFNKMGGCNRPKYGLGCRSSNGRSFVHRCNFRMKDNTFCLGNHCRATMH
jgi:hypothetical protein